MYIMYVDTEYRVNMSCFMLYVRSSVQVVENGIAVILK